MPRKKIEANCASCRFYFEMNRNAFRTGHCRRYPPHPVLVDIDPPAISSEYPQVERTEFCGEYST